MGEGREREGERGEGGGRGGVWNEEKRGETPSCLRMNLVVVGELQVDVFNFFKYDNTLIYCLLDFWFKVALKAL